MRSIFTLFVIFASLLGCKKRNHSEAFPPQKQLRMTGQWHREEEAKIDKAVSELRSIGKWDERWDKFSRLGTFGWRSGMDCADERKSDKPVPCISGGYTFSESAFEQLKRGDASHDALNTPEQSEESFRQVIENRR